MTFGMLLHNAKIARKSEIAKFPPYIFLSKGAKTSSCMFGALLWMQKMLDCMSEAMPFMPKKALQNCGFITSRQVMKPQKCFFITSRQVMKSRIHFFITSQQVMKPRMRRASDQRFGIALQVCNGMCAL